VTLVIKPTYPSVRTLYCLSSHTTLDEARENLRAREDTTNLNNIGYLNFLENAQQVRTNNAFLLKTLVAWNADKHFDAVIWSDFAPNFTDKRKLPLTATNIRDYISTLSPSDRASAIEYIVKAPQQIKTRHRNALEDTLK